MDIFLYQRGETMNKVVLASILAGGIFTSAAAFATYGDLNVKSNIQETINVYCYRSDSADTDPTNKSFKFTPAVSAEGTETYQLTERFPHADHIGCNVYVAKGSDETLAGAYMFHLYGDKGSMAVISQGFNSGPSYKTTSIPDVNSVALPEITLITSYSAIK
jgi:hypothetical protein